MEAKEVKKLITEDGDATDYYIEIIESIFKRFDTDKDGYLNMDEFNGMLKISNEELATEESFENIVMLFDNDLDEGGDEENEEEAEKKLQQKVNRGVSLRSFIQMSIVSTTRVRFRDNCFTFGLIESQL